MKKVWMSVDATEIEMKKRFTIYNKILSHFFLQMKIILYLKQYQMRQQN